MVHPSTALAASTLALVVLYIGLGLRVAWLRIRLRVGIGEGKKPEHRPLKRAIRVHGNFGEWVPITLFVLLLAELRGVDPTVVGGLGAALVVARLGHAFGLSRSIGPSIGRTGGLTLHLLVLLGAAVAAVLA